MDYDRTAMPAAYDAGRGYSPELLEFWLRKIASAVRGTEIEAILDLGCGTGRYSAGLAAHFGVPVIAVDPSEKMLAEARDKPANGVRFAIGSAEAIPLEDAAVDMVFMSMVFHHFDNPRKAVEECRRVLRPGGVVVLRNGTTDQVAGYPYTPFFARASSLFTASLTSKAFITETFEAGGFQSVHYELVRSKSAPSWSAYADKIAHRADSILARLTDEEFEAGLAVLRDHAAKAPPAEPVIEPIDLFVFRRP
jgi:ubiquinone/menaquinone biosynthesis C-methylase UbiE